MISSAAPPPVADFVRRAEFGQIKISPNGTYLAVTIPMEDRTALSIIRLADRKVAGALNFSGEQHVADFSWAGDKRLVAALAEQHGELAQPELTGELFAIDAEHGSSSYLFGYRGKDSVGSHISGATKEYASAHFVAAPDDDPDRALIAADFWNGDSAGITQLFRIDLRTGAKLPAGRAPANGNADFLADRQGIARYAVVRDTQFQLHTYWRDDRNQPWQQENAGALADAEIFPLKFSPDGKAVYLLSTEGGDSSCLVRRELSGEHARKSMGCGYTEVIFSFDGQEPIAALRNSGKPGLVLLDSPHPDRVLLERLQKSFGGDQVLPVSQSRDGSKVVLLVYSDRNPGDFYLYDAASKKAEYIMSRRRWIEPAQMGERRPIQFAARDGHRLAGYLTLPPGVTQPAKLPLVVMPHGGPFHLSDHWEWDADSQLFASRGYAVLQVNFRGSGGFGLAHREAGRKQWGTLMIDDISDGTRYVAEQGWADPARTCIFGASYGGYAALMSAVREPQLYRCAAAYDGAYDLAIQASDSDTARTAAGRAYLRDYMGTNPELMREQSPINFIDKLQAALFLAHGKLDERTPYSQFEHLTAALNKRHYPYEQLVETDEGHGFYRLAHREELYTRLLAFFDRNIGKAALAQEARTRTQP